MHRPLGRKSLHIGGVKTAVLIINALYPPAYRTLKMEQRNTCIWEEFQDGQGLSDIARKYKLWPQRVHQMIQKKLSSGTGSPNE